MGEIGVVFIGVSAAFLLSAWQAHRQDPASHLQILDSMEQELSREVQHAKEEAAASQEAINTFRHELAAGEMPALHLMIFTSDYDPADDVALSQAGADHLLNFDTIEALKQLRKIERMGLMLMHNYQQLANELLAPQLNDPREKFYDPQTKQLQPMFAWYPRAKEDSNQFVQDYLAATETLLIQVRKERTKLR